MSNTKYLGAFCDGTDARGLGKPFSLGSWTYATDGVIALRVPSAEELRPGRGDNPAQEAAASLPFPVAGSGQCVAPLPELPARIFEECPEQRTMLGKCGKSCPECGGAGRVAKCQSVQIGVHDFNSEYLRIMKMFLRNVRTNKPATESAKLCFTFDGGSGLLCALSTLD